MPDFIAMLLVVVASLTGCGKDSRSPATKVDPHEFAAASKTERKPCEYVKRADAEKVVGVALPQTNENTTTNECDYNSPEFYGSAVTIGPWDGCKSAIDNGSPHAQPIAGLGDEAFFVREHVFIHKGERCLSVSKSRPAPFSWTPPIPLPS
jgi:hypothetical protein